MQVESAYVKAPTRSGRRALLIILIFSFAAAGSLIYLHLTNPAAECWTCL